MNHTQNLQTAFNVDLDGLQEMVNDLNNDGKVLIVEEPNSNLPGIHYIMNSKSKYKQYTPVKLLKEVRYYTHHLNYAICNVEDVIETELPPKPLKKKHDITPEMTTKIMNAAAKLYQLHPDFFIPAFKQVKSDTVLNHKMKIRFPDHADRKLMYRAIAYVQKLVNDGDAWKIAITKSSNFYKIPYKDLESLIQIKTANKKL